MTDTRKKTPVLLALASVCFVIGVVAIIAMFAVLVSGGAPGLWLYLTAMIFLPLGFVLMIAFTLRSGRRARR
ncbi:hypothetical protein [Rhodococcoides trifolii]|uniref:hypothetical protein n=1 Tax=Rhodococcoides trifolii TaxID=908250 RepID=UPI0016678273|nr:hypothetical protein [Rhodococcus trifolii]